MHRAGEVLGSFKLSLQEDFVGDNLNNFQAIPSAERERDRRRLRSEPEASKQVAPGPA